MADDASGAGSRLEPPDVATRPVLLVGCGILVFIGLSLAGLKAYFGMEVTRPIDSRVTAFPQPQLETDDAVDRAKLEREQRQALDGYAWVDRNRGVIRIPIGEAMRKIEARGSDAYAPLPSMPAVQPPANPAQRRLP